MPTYPTATATTVRVPGAWHGGGGEVRPVLETETGAAGA
jgi:hypothetical protein